MEQECQGTFIYLTSVVGFIAISVIKMEDSLRLVVLVLVAVEALQTTRV